jgi:hypothetical protein
MITRAGDPSVVHDYAGDVVTITVWNEGIDAMGNHAFWVVARQGPHQQFETRDVPSADR